VLKEIEDNDNDLNTILFVIGTYSIGKEDFVKAVADVVFRKALSKELS